MGEIVVNHGNRCRLRDGEPALRYPSPHAPATTSTCARRAAGNNPFAQFDRDRRTSGQAHQLPTSRRSVPPSSRCVWATPVGVQRVHGDLHLGQVDGLTRASSSVDGSSGRCKRVRVAIRSDGEHWLVVVGAQPVAGLLLSHPRAVPVTAGDAEASCGRRRVRRAISIADRE